MTARISAAESALERLIRSFQSGELTQAEMRDEVDRLLALGASPGRLLRVLHQSDTAERLSESVQEDLLRLVRSVESSDRSDFSGPPTIVLEDSFVGSAAGARTHARDPERAVDVGTTLLGRFRLVELIGTGGMSRVYKAVDLAPSATSSAAEFVAVKVLDRAGDVALEALPLLRLEHANIVRLFGIERDGPIVFLVMELLAGTSLYRRLAERPLDPTEARSVIAAVASALEYAHRRGVVHGDLKPGNVIVGETGVKVIDFGIAGWISEAQDARRMVTPQYASPQLMAGHAPEIADDVYALACVAYELLTGVQAAERPAEPAVNFAPPLRPPLASTEYVAIVHALEREPRNRTASVAQFMAQFTAPLPRAAAASEPPSTFAATKRMAPAAWAAVAAALVILGIAWFQLFRVQRSSPAPPLQPPAAAATEHVAVPPAVEAPEGPVPAPGTSMRDCATCPLMAVLPAGQFMTSLETSASSDDRGAHLVTIPHPFALATDDVTVGEFAEFAAATHRDMRGCDTYDGDWHRQSAASWKSPGFAQTPRHPATCASWSDAVAYVEWLSAKTSHSYRLPTAAEWEYAARGGSPAVRPWESNAMACSQANIADESAARRYPGWTVFACDDHFVHTAPVGSFKANAFGLRDMLGNVFQWTQDCWHAGHGSAGGDAAPQNGVRCAERELRGGSWFSAPSFVRTSYRNHFPADYRASSIGFRIARDLAP